MTEPEIETGVPVPPRSGPRTVMGKLAAKMKNGESLLCQSEQELEVVRTAIRRLGGKYQQRKMDGGWRVWRIA